MIAHGSFFVGLLFGFLSFWNPAQASAQIFECRDCNNLTHECQTEPVSGDLDEICTQGTSGGGWCHSHGGLGDPCIEMPQLDADGTIPQMEDLAIEIATVKEELTEPKDAFSRDCLSRVRSIAFNAREGQDMRSESAVIIL